MIIVRKKRILFILGFVFISIFVSTLGMNKNNTTIPTVSLPVSNKVIVLDARSWCAR